MGDARVVTGAMRARVWRRAKGGHVPAATLRTEDDVGDIDGRFGRRPSRFLQRGLVGVWHHDLGHLGIGDHEQREEVGAKGLLLAGVHPLLLGVAPDTVVLGVDACLDPRIGHNIGFQAPISIR